MSRVSDSLKIISKKVRKEGLGPTAQVLYETFSEREKFRKNTKVNPDQCTFFDVMFINGCDYSLPHPVRYRVDHQIEQCEANGLSVTRADAWSLTDEHLTRARSFVFFRCPNSPALTDFITKLKAMNKKVYFDIDDLVVDVKYTDTVKYLDSLTPDEKALYDNGVVLMGETLKLCGSAITTTDRLAEELSTMVPEVFLNRNVASERMLFYSNRAVFERDELPYLEDHQLKENKPVYREWARKKAQARKAEGTVIGYFSGSITHNDDFEIVLPAIVSVMEKRPDVHLRLVGELDLPQELEPFRSRILKSEFCEWEHLPSLIASADINIAPLADTIFNEAKSENKWVEASLVKVPTVASRVGAFGQMIEDGRTGILCDTADDWEQALLSLVDDKEKRLAIGKSAHDYCAEHCTTVESGINLVRYIREKQVPNLFMLLPSFEISGGVLVALRHCCILQDAGFDVTLVDNSGDWKRPLYTIEDHTFPVVTVESENNRDDKILLRGLVDRLVATFWITTFVFDKYWNIGRKMYLVQSRESMFYKAPDIHKRLANATYGRLNVEYLTVSKWCLNWLENTYKQSVRYVANGIDSSEFSPCERDYDSADKIRILIEGSSVSHYKNVDEAFEIVAKLDPEKYEIWYVCYEGKPKDFYRVDKFMHKVPHEKMVEIYQSCHILLKTSVLESFSYPPLEMMSTGGQVVVLPNEGNSEYIVDGENCLTYTKGDHDEAVSKIETIVSDSALRKKFYENGIAVAQRLDWENLREQVVALYR